MRELVEISRYYGRSEEFVLAGGGNTSFKDDENLYVKASGVGLAAIDQSGFVKMNRASLEELWSRDYPAEPEAREQAVLRDVMAAREPGETGRPSVEVLLHALFHRSYVVHTHPPMMNGLTCGRHGEKRAAELFGADALWIPVMEPGYVLSAFVRKRLAEYESEQRRQPPILLMQNHGLLVAGDDPEAVRETTDRVMDRLRSAVGEEPDFTGVGFDRERAVLLAPALRMLIKGDGDASIVVFLANREIHGLVKSEESFRPVSSPFTPDHIVYCNSTPLFVPHRGGLEEQYAELAKAVAGYRKTRGYAPKIVAVQNLGVFACSPTLKQARSARSLFLDAVKVARYSRSFGGPQFLPSELVDFIEDWEVESYRRRAGAAAGAAGPLRERIALVTGGAQGIGKGIAAFLVDRGANVTVADIRREAAEETARELAAEHGEARALAAGADVGDDASVRRSIEETVLAFGGIDLYVSNAGIIEAGGLDRLEPAAFERVTRVNYTGYFLGARHSSRIMDIQHRFASEWTMDIVQINSKSGLEGSNRNFAYAGGKAGGIGLTQSFALELVDRKIKVNAICPGNFFDGPLWSDPKSGLFVLYLKAGKIPGAETVADVRKHYEEKIPMGRGCRITDITRALLYIVEQEYETGQAVPVTGGQIMLK